MSKSLLYHAFGIRGYDLKRTNFESGSVYFTIAQPRRSYQCPLCRSNNVKGKGKKERTFHSLPIGKKPTFVIFHVPRVECAKCDIIRQVRVPFAEPGVTYTRAFERHALRLLSAMTIQDVALHLHVSWDLIKDIQKRYLQLRFAKPKLKHLKQIAIDEISVGAGHKYVTLVLDLEEGVVVFVGDGKGAATLEPFWRRLRASHAQIGAVATDMSPAFISAVQQRLPRAMLVFDRFHVIKLYNEKLSALRRSLYGELSDSKKKGVLKGVRWLLLKRPENLDASRDEPTRLRKALRLNEPLSIAYYLKEELNETWEQDDAETATRHLLCWIATAESAGVPILKKFAQTLRDYAWGILAHYDHPISTGPLEGINNKIKTMKRQAYGFRDREFLKLRILGIHETRYAIVG